MNLESELKAIIKHHRENPLVIVRLSTLQTIFEKKEFDPRVLEQIVLTISAFLSSREKRDLARIETFVRNNFQSVRDKSGSLDEMSEMKMAHLKVSVVTDEEVEESARKAEEAPDDDSSLSLGDTPQTITENQARARALEARRTASDEEAERAAVDDDSDQDDESEDGDSDFNSEDDNDCDCQDCQKDRSKK